MSPKQLDLKKEHGTPAEFERAVWKACDALYITPGEARAAIAKYKQEWLDAAEIPLPDQPPDGGRERPN
jgi:hypothetical protein